MILNKKLSLKLKVITNNNLIEVGTFNKYFLTNKTNPHYCI